MRRTWAAIAVGATLLLGASQAGAARTGPPATYFRYGGDNLQRGHLGTHCWSGDRVAWCADAYGYSFPKTAAYVPADTTARIRVRYAPRPEKLRLSAWTRVDGDGQPLGKRMRIATNLKPVRRDGEVVAWDALFQLPKPAHDYYIDTLIDWGNDAYYQFHLTTRR